ncbi:DUF2306 domain-containing protein [Brevundimonas sp. TWP2-3-2]|uniref:DUF2306 domain-containing protein n=1 Tax=unclassified Brevundimonas TaxID=2622653 RepID=UPI003CF730B9
MSTTDQTPPVRGLASKALRWSGMLWFIVAAVGQTAFIGFIVAFYGVRTVTGDFAGWNDKPLIDGYIEGDHTGNLIFAAHVLLAAVVTLGGLMQLIPVIRRKLPGLHRWTGRTFLVIAGFMALSGIWLALVRGTYLSVISNVAILIDALLILVFAGFAWRNAIKRRFEPHRIWAMRTFMVVSGVWFLRVGLMGWVIVNQGPAGLTKDMSGPIDSIMTFGSYLIPLTLLELYFAAQRSSGGTLKILAALVVVAAAAYTALGVVGTVAFMWGPYL